MNDGYESFCENCPNRIVYSDRDGADGSYQLGYDCASPDECGVGDDE